jgi:CubicO group peptidase (beta-lactamase class C family)
MNELNGKIKKIFSGAVRSAHIHEAALLVENTKGNFSASYGYGGKNVDALMNSASIGKMYTAACILKLCGQNKLTLDDTLSKYFEKPALDGLHIRKNTEYSYKLTVADLLFQTSGLPDIFIVGDAKTELVNADFYMNFDDVLARIKKMKPRFAPNTTGKAYYSDCNFDLLGEIIKKITEKPLSEVYREFLFEPLGLTKTYIPASENDFIPNMYYKDKSLHRPNAILSSAASGGVVTTAREMMLFLKGFWNGSFFPKHLLPKLAVYRKLQWEMSPIRYGGGYMQIPLGGLTTMFMGNGELIGHSGATACGAFYCPQKDLYIVCDFNQLAKPALPIRVSLKITMLVK